MHYIFLNKAKYITLVFLSLFCFDTFGSSDYGCDFQTSDYLEQLGNLNEIESIEITVDDYRKWTKNTLNAFIARETSILEKYKKKYFGTVIINYHFGKCLHRAKIRLHGDLKDHIKFVNKGDLSQSIDVSLIDGSIANIVKFKLLLPETRFHENEIIVTKILRMIDLIAPRTSLLESEINGVKSTMLFQEKISKELLENMERREGPLFEGDERFLFNNFNSQRKNLTHLDLENISLSKITNDDWASDNFIHSTISIQSFSILQSAYLKYALNFSDDYVLDWKILSNNNKKSLERWAMYEMFLFSINGYHALRPHNRKFYFNSIEDAFEPIYYDGNPMKISSSDILKIPRYDKYPLLNIEHFRTLYSKISSIDPLKFANTLEGNKFLINEGEAKKILQEITNKINDLRLKFSFSRSQEINSKKLSMLIDNSFEELKKNIILSMPDAYILTIEKDQKNRVFKTSLCRISDEFCEEYDLDISKVGSMLEKKIIKKVDIQNPIFINSQLNKKAEYRRFNFKNNKINIKSSKSMIIQFNELDNELYFNAIAEGDWALIENSDLTDVKIKFNTQLKFFKATDSISRINEYGLTGCLTIHQSKFNNTSIEADGKNTNCEDVINLMKTIGQINQINILNGSADGLDVDFSDIEIDILSVEGAMNDCADFSQGSYNIRLIIMQKCGDKGISVGEKSSFYGNIIKIDQSKIGISSKDSSKTFVNDFLTSNVNVCAEAFQKKQEFDGAEITFLNIKCELNKFNVDNNSRINEL